MEKKNIFYQPEGNKWCKTFKACFLFSFISQGFMPRRQEINQLVENNTKQNL
jgi:hypothetical protein